MHGIRGVCKWGRGAMRCKLFLFLFTKRCDLQYSWRAARCSLRAASLSNRSPPVAKRCSWWIVSQHCCRISCACDRRAVSSWPSTAIGIEHGCHMQLAAARTDCLAEETNSPFCPVALLFGRPTSVAAIAVAAAAIRSVAQPNTL